MTLTKTKISTKILFGSKVRPLHITINTVAVGAEEVGRCSDEEAAAAGAADDELSTVLLTILSIILYCIFADSI